MWQLTIIVPLFSLLVERFLELFDALVVLNLFPWWRSAPLPPPIMLLQEPLKEAWDCYGKATGRERYTPETGEWGEPTSQESHSSGKVGDKVALPGDDKVDKPVDKIIYTIGSSKLELTITTYKEAKFYYQKEEELHQRRLVYYIAKYGYFLPKSEKGLRQRLFNLALKMEAWLASREGVSHKNKDVVMAKCIQDIDLSKLSQYDSLTQKLDLCADYCYLRNQRTYEAFSFVKRQVYFVFGVLLGVCIANLLDIYNNVLLGGFSVPTPTAYLGGSSGLLDVGFGLLFNGGNRAAAAIWNSGLGAAAAMGSQQAHWVTNRLQLRTTPREPYTPAAR